jgi:DNA-binding CsgD family transcriptional regulator
VLGLGRVSDPTLTVIVLSATDDSALIDAAFAHGASAYVLKTSDPDVIATAVRQAFEPSLYFARPKQPVEAPVVELAPPKLTRRELEILTLVSEGRSNRQVAELLWVTDQTVKFHLANVYRKLGVRSRFDAARWAFEHGLLESADEALTRGEADEKLVANGNGNGNGNGHANGNGNGNGNGQVNGNGNGHRNAKPGTAALVRVTPRGRLEGTSR